MFKRERALGQWLFYLLAVLVLAACGGGGDDLLPTVQGTSDYRLSVSLASSRIAPSGSTTVTATLTDSTGSPAANRTVSFALTTGSPGSLSASTATTNASGVTTITLTGSGSGSGQVRVSHIDRNNNLVTNATPFSINTSNNILMITSKTDVKSGSGDNVTVDAFITDVNGGPVTNSNVIFTVEGGIQNGTLSASTVATDTTGRARVVFAPSSIDRSNKTATVTASTGTGDNLASTSTTLNVTGTIIELSAPQNTVSLGTSINVTGTLKDGNGIVIANQAMTLTTAPTGNALSSSSATTDAAGKVTFSATINNQIGGQATITATAAGTSSTLTLSVSTQSFAFTTPTEGAETQISAGSIPVTVRFTNGGVAVPGQTVFFSTTLGTLGATSATTDSNGDASTTISSSFAGQSLIRANTTNNTQVTSRAIEFVAVTPQKITVQAASTTVLPGQQTETVATVQDGANNPVKNKIIEFALVKNDSQGNLSAAAATTDSSGKAKITFTAGPSSGAQDGTEISATVQDARTVTTDPNANVKLTVGGQSAFITIGTGASMIALDITTYAVPHTVLITAADGSPIANQLITLRVIPVKYYKGRYLFVPAANRWKTFANDRISPPTPCSNEDIDLDGKLDTIENDTAGVQADPMDYPSTINVEDNGDGILWPGQPVTISSSQVKTDNNGFAAFNVLYPKSFANWLRVKVLATTQVSGTESKTERIFDLLALTTDITQSDILPPGGEEGPYGLENVCTNRN